MTTNTPKKPLLDLNNYAEEIANDERHHALNQDTYLRALFVIKLYEIGKFNKNELDKNLNIIFNNRQKLIKSHKHTEGQKGLINITLKEILIVVISALLGWGLGKLG